MRIFKIFNNKKEFCFIEKKFQECILCKQKIESIVEPFYHFLLINEDNIKFKTILKILINKCKENLSTECTCKTSNDGFLTTKIQYVINSFPDYFFVLIDMNYTTMKKFKNEIIALS